MVFCYRVSAAIQKVLSSRPDDHVVWTNTGYVRGTLVDKYCDPSSVWLGVPYARPPLEELRFKPPVPISPWRYVLDATQPPKSCFIRMINSVGRDLTAINKKEMSEDCLTLNIIAPYQYKEEDYHLPVIVYIHGEELQQRSLSMRLYQTQCLASMGNVIVVTINSRVSSLGYLRIDDNTAAGNMGLLDQQLAMKWIKENIEYFGGDSQNITLLGAASGGLLASFHLLAKKSNGLFNRAIIQNDIATADWTISSDSASLHTAQVLGEAVGCTYVYENQSLFECLQYADPYALVSSLQPSIDNLFLPTIDGTFITDLPENILAKKSFHDFEIILGNTRDEEDLIVFQILKTLYGLSLYHIPNHISRDMAIETGKILLSMTTIHPSNAPYIIDYYAAKTKYNYFRALSRAVGDLSFSCPVNVLADTLSKKGAKVYKYVFAHATEYAPWRPHLGVIQKESILYFLGAPFQKDFPITFTNDEEILSERMIHLWSEFAKTGIPCNYWTPYTSKSQEYLWLDTYAPILQNAWRSRQCYDLGKIIKY